MSANIYEHLQKSFFLAIFVKTKTSDYGTINDKLLNAVSRAFACVSVYTYKASACLVCDNWGRDMRDCL